MTWWSSGGHGNQPCSLSFSSEPSVPSPHSPASPLTFRGSTNHHCCHAVGNWPVTTNCFSSGFLEVRDKVRDKDDVITEGVNGFHSIYPPKRRPVISSMYNSPRHTHTHSFYSLLFLNISYKKREDL